MSNLLETGPVDVPLGRCTCDAVTQSIAPREKDLGGFVVRRLLPHARRRMVGPFIFFDHFGPTTFPRGAGMDVRPHPHINLATLTYLFAGEILHRDNLGSVQPIRPGAVNWMSAGSGIVHSERTPPELRGAGTTLHGLQLWVALPAAAEEAPPSFHHVAAADLPLIETRGARIRLIAGSAWKHVAPVPVASPLVYLDVELRAGGRFQLPEEMPERAVYPVTGEVRAQDTALPAQTLTVFAPQPGIELTAVTDARLVVIGGEPVGPRLIWWNFVSSRPERIEQAKDDWRQGRFAAVPGETEFIPLPAE